MNALTIADALAAKYASGTLTPPSGYGAVRASTARLPNAIPTSPWVLVMLPEGEIVLGSGQLDYSLEYHVWFHYAKHTGDLARDMTAMLSWIGVLTGATWSDMDLGVTGIRKAYTTGFKLAVFTYGGDEYYGWDLTVIVEFYEPQVLTP
jgi:hypothetical protein